VLSEPESRYDPEELNILVRFLSVLDVLRSLPITAVSQLNSHRTPIIQDAFHRPPPLRTHRLNLHSHAPPLHPRPTSLPRTHCRSVHHDGHAVTIIYTCRSRPVRAEEKVGVYTPVLDDGGEGESIYPLWMQIDVWMGKMTVEGEGRR
jgi:hypothetical protein